MGVGDLRLAFGRQLIGTCDRYGALIPKIRIDRDVGQREGTIVHGRGGHFGDLLCLHREPVGSLGSVAHLKRQFSVGHLDVFQVIHLGLISRKPIVVDDFRLPGHIVGFDVCVGCAVINLLVNPCLVGLKNDVGTVCAIFHSIARLHHRSGVVMVLIIFLIGVFIGAGAARPVHQAQTDCRHERLGGIVSLDLDVVDIDLGILVRPLGDCTKSDADLAFGGFGKVEDDGVLLPCLIGEMVDNAVMALIRLCDESDDVHALCRREVVVGRVCDAVFACRQCDGLLIAYPAAPSGADAQCSARSAAVGTCGRCAHAIGLTGRAIAEGRTRRPGSTLVSILPLLPSWVSIRQPC